ncbi:type II toxin-antitoxin system RelE/ParE family toxin [Candidatus Peregrinibacteria bacterium]|nr:type II toxin-antitoxin system RelE/ParE family toxin [Candidatus Peregrinibacteria bacterium]
MKVILLRQPHKFIKRADKSLKEKIKGEVLKVQKNPSIGEKLKGEKLKGVLSHHFVFVGVNYRIAYKVIGDLIVISIATRENFYRDLQI